ncbi:dextransucrase [Azotobacter chroococcum]|nr:dextransucrase [Azotobacter chroococcum]
MRASPSQFFAISLLSITISGLLSGAAVAAQTPTALEQVPDGKGGVKWQEVQHDASAEEEQKGQGRKKFLGIQAITTEPDGSVKVEMGKPEVRQPASGDVFVSNEKLDEHVIFQAFALYQPNDNATYKALAENAPQLAQWGITDVWSPPPYRAASDSKYGEGYAIADRYDLGTYGKGPTKYGTADELKAAIGALHNNDIRIQVDVVPNQIIGLNERHVLPVTGVDMYGQPMNPFLDHYLYSTYSKGSAPGQTEHGVIKEWDYFHFHGTTTQYQGLFRVLSDANSKLYRYLGPNHPENYLPAFLAESDAAKYGKINTIDGYLLADTWFAVENAESENAVYAPLFLYYEEPRSGVVEQTFMDFARSKGYTGSDEEIRETMLAELRMTPNPIGPLMDEYLAAQPGYSKKSEDDAKVTALRYDGPENDASHIGTNVLDFEFLVGNDLDTIREDVQQEQLNWQKYLLDFGFDGFRIDAASHINTDMLRDEVTQRLNYFAGEDVNEHLSYIESYVAQQVDFEQSNNYGQMAMDAGPFSGLMFSFGRDWAPLRYAFEASLIDRVNGGPALPNWSFVNNHDQEHNILVNVPLTEEEAGGYEPNSQPYELRQLEKYDADRNSVEKQWAPHNVPAMYAILLTTKDTVPTVFYGDMFVSSKPYMSTPTPYRDDIVNILKLRKQFAKGEQVIRYENSNTGSNGEDLVSNIRLGNDRKTGVAVVAGNNPALDTTITVDMGAQHRNQWFVDAMGYQPERLKTDKDGRLTVQVKGTQNVDVKGYLAAWVPDLQAQE